MNTLVFDRVYHCPNDNFDERDSNTKVTLDVSTKPYSGLFYTLVDQ